MRKMNTRDRVDAAVFGVKQPKVSKPIINPMWYRKNRITVNGKLRQAILDVLPFTVDKKQADIILHAMFDTMKDELLSGGRVVLPKIGSLNPVRRRHISYNFKTKKKMWNEYNTVRFKVDNLFRQTGLRDKEDDGDIGKGQGT